MKDTDYYTGLHDQMPIDDPVTHPKHYISKNGLEVKTVIDEFTEGLKGKEAYYQGNIIKYILRWKNKNGVQDLQKAQVYLGYLLDLEIYKDSRAENND